MATKIDYIPIANSTVALYGPDNEWAIVTIRKETSGDVIVGTKNQMSATAGMSLSTDNPTTLLVSPGTTLFGYAPDSQQVSITMTRVPISLAITVLEKLVRALGKC